MITKQEIEQRIENLINSKQQLILQVNKTLGEIEGRIEVYRDLLKEMEEDDGEGQAD